IVAGDRRKVCGLSDLSGNEPARVERRACLLVAPSPSGAARRPLFLAIWRIVMDERDLLERHDPGLEHLLERRVVDGEGAVYALPVGSHGAPPHDRQVLSLAFALRRAQMMARPSLRAPMARRHQRDPAPMTYGPTGVSTCGFVSLPPIVNVPARRAASS